MTTSQPERPKGGSRLKELDGWAFSEWFVIAHHRGTYRYRRLVAPRTHLAPICENLGSFGVGIFRVISGFVICRLLILEVSAAISLIPIYAVECDCRLQGNSSLGPVQAGGLISYGIHPWQQLFTAPPRFYFATGQIIPSMLPLLFAIILISYSFVERPLMRYGRKLADEARKTLRVCRIGTEAEASACSEIG